MFEILIKFSRLLVGLLIALGGWSLSRTFELSTGQAVLLNQVDQLEFNVQMLEEKIDKMMDSDKDIMDQHKKLFENFDSERKVYGLDELIKMEDWIKSFWESIENVEEDNIVDIFIGIEDKFGKTNVDGVYAIGDLTPGQALAHVASKEAIICVENFAHKEGKYKHQPEPIDYGNVPGCTYCSPEIASVGMTEKQAKDAGYELKVGKFPFSASGKASAAGATEGFVKVIFDAKYGEWLGTHMIGANVTEIIAQTVTARKLETTWHEVLDSIHPHPTMSESVKDAIEVALGEAIHL